jgi:putative NADPH-quinone reductase
MKKTVIVYNHPYVGSFCHALLVRTVKGLEAQGRKVDVMNLDQDEFNPVMTGEDLLGFVQHDMQDPQAKDYVKRLKEADHLVFIFPIWWELMPALTKGFIDKVIFPGATYEYTKSGMGMNTLLGNIQTVDVITTMNTPKPIYRFIFGNAIKNALIKGTLKKSGIKNVHWVSFNMVKTSSTKKRAKWLTKLETLMGKR